MKGWPITRKTVWGIAGVCTVFALGLGGGTLLARYVVVKKEPRVVPRLSDIAAPPEETGKRDPSSLPPIGLSPVPVGEPQTPGTAVQEGGHEQPLRIPWAEPYPAHPFTLTDHEGRQVSLRDLSGRVVVLSFIYTHCKTTCPLLTQELKQLQEALGPLMGREVVFLSLTIDPQRDTPAVLKRYGEVHGVDFRSWRFLTGSEGTMRQILEAYHVPVRVEKPSGAHADGYELGHGNPIYLIDQWGRVRKRTAPTMLVRLGRPAIEWLVREGASDVNADADLVQLGEKGKP